MDKLSFDERKEYARFLYTRHDLSIKDIALTVGVEEAAVRNWIHEGLWNEVKRSLLTSKTMQLGHYYSQLEKLDAKLKEGKDAGPKDIDLVVKYTTAIKNLETEVSISSIIEVSELLILWVKRKDLKLAQKLIVHFNAFVKHRIAA